MIHHQEKYQDYIKENGIGSNDKTADSVKSYLSYLNSVSKYLDIDITLKTLGCEDDVCSLCEQLKQLGKVSDKTISNYGSAMRQYVNMVNTHE